VMASFRSPFPMLACDRLLATVRFYRDLLGFRQTYRFPEEGDPDFVSLELDGAAIGLASKRNPPIHGRPFGERGGHFFELCVYTDDVDAAVEQLRGAGAPILVDPCDQPWGERIAYVCDPADNPVISAAAAGD
jgi:lactoylglutathione lyase